MTIGRRTLAGSVLALSLLLGAGLLAYRSVLDLMERQRWIEHTLEVLKTIEAVVSLTVDGETAERGYMITGREQYLQLREVGHEPLAQGLQSLRELTADNSSQQRHVDELEGLVRVKQAFIDRLVAARRAHGLGALSDDSLLEPANKAMEDIRSLADTMKDEERARLFQREAAAAVQTRRTLAVIVGGALVGVGLLAVVLSLLYREIGRRTRTERRLRESEERLNLALNSAAVGTWSWNIGEDAIIWDDYLHPLFGLEPGTFGGRYEDFARLLHADDRDRVAREVGNAVELDIPFDTAYRTVWADGSIHTIAARGKVYRAGDGRALRMTGVCWDITERMEAEESFRLVIETAPNGILMVSPEGRIALVNAAAERIFGLTRAELLDKPVEMLLPERYRGTHPAARTAFLANPNSRSMGAGRDLYGLHGDGSEIPVEIGLAPMPTAKGTFVLASVLDISERKLIEKQLEEHSVQLQEANEALGSFTYSVSHDLRAPLRAIDGYARILLEDHADHLDAEGQRVLGVVCANARSMGKLIDDLLRFSRLGRSDLEKARVDMTVVAQSVVEELQRLEPERRVAVTIAPLAPAFADGTLIRQVLTNLIGNAWKFTRTRAEATIDIGCTSGAGELTYFVRDNGAGFETAYADKLFGVFQRLHRAEEFEGTGVGLAIVQRIVQRHGGRVWAEGAVDRGATFYFTLPAEGGVQHGAHGSRDIARRGQPSGRRAGAQSPTEAEPG